MTSPVRSPEQQIAEQAEMMFFNQKDMPKIEHTKKGNYRNQIVDYAILGGMVLTALFLAIYYLISFLINAL